MEHQRPLCPQCSKIIEKLGVWVDEQKLTAILFCPECGKVLSAQLLEKGRQEI